MGSITLAQALGTIGGALGRVVEPARVHTVLDTSMLLLAAGCGLLALLLVASTSHAEVTLPGPETQPARPVAAGGPPRTARAARTAVAPVASTHLTEVSSTPRPGPRWSAAPRTAVATSASRQRAAARALRPATPRTATPGTAIVWRAAPWSTARTTWTPPAAAPVTGATPRVLAATPSRCPRCTRPRCVPTAGRQGGERAARPAVPRVPAPRRPADQGSWLRCRSPCTGLTALTALRATGPGAPTGARSTSALTTAGTAGTRTAGTRTAGTRTDMHRTDMHRTDMHRTDMHRTDMNRTDMNRTDMHRTDMHRTATSQGAS